MIRSWSASSMPWKLIVKNSFHSSFLFVILLSLATLSGWGQSNDSLRMVSAEEVTERPDTIIEDSTHSVKKATLLALIPGAGQIYNGKYWKLPLVYGALAGTIYATSFNHDQYQIYLHAFETRIDDDPANDEFSGVYDERQLIELQNTYRKWRDLSIILTAAAYGLQILDAYVDAHLHSYDVSDDLTLRWEPALIQTDYAYTPAAVGFGITLQFK